MLPSIGKSAPTAQVCEGYNLHDMVTYLHRLKRAHDSSRDPDIVKLKDLCPAAGESKERPSRRKSPTESQQSESPSCSAPDTCEVAKSPSCSQVPDTDVFDKVMSDVLDNNPGMSMEDASFHAHHMTLGTHDDDSSSEFHMALGTQVGGVNSELRGRAVEISDRLVVSFTAHTCVRSVDAHVSS